MNSLIKTLNEWGGRFLDFAGPMFWQAGLLIVALLAFDFLFRHKVRASVRYALWLVVLVKLILPPALALPTSPAWWLHSNQLAISAKPIIKNYTVSYDPSPLPDNSLKTLTAFVPPNPVMTWAAWLLVLSAVVSAVLFVWLLVRWWQITRQVSRAKTSGRLTAIVAEARLLAGVCGEPPVKLTANTMSPAVCGLFRPAILIPESLAEHFSEEQMRAVLLHELIHLRRRDVWLNFWQSLLQIVYWWHPLVWVANARIRRVREEAVDDAVMLALAGEAETYAPTLLEVAKLALNRPLASLGLVGILESRSALRERIERLVDFRAPRQAGLTLVSIFGVLAFSAVAVPMGGAPGGSDEPTLPSAAVVVVATNKTEVRLPQIYIQADFYRMSDADFENLVSVLKFNQGEKASDSWWSASSGEFVQLAKSLKVSGFQPFMKPRIQTTSGQPADFYVGDGGTNGLELDCLPFVADGVISLNSQSKIIQTVNRVAVTNLLSDQVAIQNFGGLVLHLKDASGSNAVVVIGAQILTGLHPQRLVEVIDHAKPSPVDEDKVATMVQDAKLYYEMGALDKSEASVESALALNPDNTTAKYFLKLIAETRHKHQIQIDQFGPFVNTPLGQVMRELSEAAKRSDPEKQGVSFLFGSPLGDPAKPPLDVNSVFVNLPLDLKQVKLGDILNAIKKSSSGPIDFSFGDNTIAYWVEDRQALILRTFKLDFETLKTNLRKQVKVEAGASSADVTEACRTLFSKAGVDWNSPEGKVILYNDHLGILFVKATEPDLTVVEHAIQLISAAPLQVHIKARFIEVPEGSLTGLIKDFDVTRPWNQLTRQPSQHAGILTSENFKTAWQTLEHLPGSIELAEPEVTTTSARQTQVKATKTVDIVTNFVFRQNSTNGANAVVAKESAMEFGPILDIVPLIAADGYTFNLQLTASRTEFLGYAEVPPNTVPQFATNSAGETIPLPIIWPAVQVNRESADVNLFDGQTLVLTPDPEVMQFGAPDKKRDEIVARHIQKGDKIQGGAGKQLVVFVTVELVDSYGKRLHVDDDLSFAEKDIPRQPLAVSALY